MRDTTHRPPTGTWLERLPLFKPGWFGSIAAAIGAIAIAIFARLPLEPLLQGQLAFATLFPILLISTLIFGARTGIIILVIGGAIPIAVFRTGQPPIEMAAFYGVWLITGALIVAVTLTLRRLHADVMKSRTEAQTERARLQTVVEEMQHRARNLLTIMDTVTIESAYHAESVESFRERLLGRIRALADGYQLLTATAGGPVQLSAVLAQSLKPFTADGRIETSGPLDIRVPASLGVSLALAMNELATNAVKYGALSQESGHVRCTWIYEADGRVKLQWRESGGPPVVKPERRGFGTRLIGRILHGQANADAELCFAPEGVVCTLVFEDAEAGAR
jgi:two-component sensor histidine kinase